MPQKEKDKESRHNSTTGRRAKEHSRTVSDRVSPPQPRTSELSLYSQQNLTLDQLPPLPSSGATSPSSSTSPVLRANRLLAKQPEVSRLPHHFHTPASLQPYLQDDEEVDDADDGSHFERRDIDKPSVIIQKTVQPSLESCSNIEKETPQGHFEEAVCDLTSSCPTLPTRTRQDSPPLTSPRLSGSVQHRPSFGYSSVGNPLSPPLPAGPVYTNEQFFVPRYPIPHHFAMAQSSNRAGELQQMHVQPMPYFPGYGYASRPPMPFNPPNNLNYQSQGQSSFEHDIPTSSRIAGRDLEMSMGGGFSNAHDDAGELLHRIQNAIPDIHLLLQRYRETTGRLGLQENTVRQVELQTAEALRQKEMYIEQVAKEMDSESQKHASETSRLRLEIGNLEEKHKELLESVIASKESKAELEATYDAWREQAKQDYELRERSLKEEAQGNEKVEAAIDSMIAKMNSVHLRRLSDHEAKWRQERKELEATHMRNMKDLEVALEACRADLEDALRRAREGKDCWKKEREALQRSWDEQRTALCNEWEEERQSLLMHHERSLEELQRDLQRSRRTSHHGSHNRMEEENERLRQQVEGLRVGWEADKAKFNRATGELRAVAEKLDSENGRLHQIIEAFGEATDLKSRGDTFL